MRPLPGASRRCRRQLADATCCPARAGRRGLCFFDGNTYDTWWFLMIPGLGCNLELCEMLRMKRQSLKDADISSHRSVSRRTLFFSLGVGAAAVAATIGTAATAQAPPKPLPRPADPCRDRDRGPSDQDGCPTS